MRPINVGKREFKVERKRDHKGRPGTVIVAYDELGLPVAEGHTRAEVHTKLEALRTARR